MQTRNHNVSVLLATVLAILMPAATIAQGGGQGGGGYGGGNGGGQGGGYGQPGHGNWQCEIVPAGAVIARSMV